MKANRSLRAAGLCAVLASIGSTGCGPDFDEVSEIQELRVLGIQSEPVAPAPGESTTLTPFVVPLNPADALTYEWSWCPLPGAADDQYPCLVSEEQLAMLAGGTGTSSGSGFPPYNLGTGPTAVFPHNIPPAALQAVCAGLIPGLPVSPDCTGGFPVQIKMTVRSPTDEVIVVRELRLRLDDLTPGNNNPAIASLNLRWGPILTQLDGEGTITVPRLRKSVLWADVDPAMAEAYVGKTPMGEDDAKRERLTLSWFVQSGTLENTRTTYIPGETEAHPSATVDFCYGVPLCRFYRNAWKPEDKDDFEPELMKIIVVLRDNRDGISWHQAAVTLGAPTK